MEGRLLSTPCEHLPSHLPPLDAWLTDPTKLRKFYAPVDDRGFVLPEATVEMIGELFDPQYAWPVDMRYQPTRPDLHHFHWIGRLYQPTRYQGRRAPAQFRELPTVKGIVPRQFHNVIHAVTLPPNIPKYRDMEKHVRAYYLARQLFRTAQAAADTRSAVGHAREQYGTEDEIATEMLIQKFDRQFHGYHEAIDSLLDEHALEELHLTINKLPKRPPHEVVRLLGRVVTDKVVNYVPYLNHTPLDEVA